jgi:hypothetical protein
MSKQDTRIELSSDLDKFFSAGGTVTVLKSTRVKRKHTATGQQKLSFKWKEPHQYPVSSWHYIESI